MQASISKSKSRRQPVSSKKTFRGKSARAEPVLERQSVRVDTRSARRNSTKRALKDKTLKERSVRFRSTDEEYVFDNDTLNYPEVPEGSDIFQTILKEMKDNFARGIDDDVDDEVFDGVFTATVTLDKVEKKYPTKKTTCPGKSILKRRTSLRS